MSSYYVNNHAQSNGDHEVHVSTCAYFSQIVSKKYLGEFFSCEPAVTEAKKTYKQSNGCYYCCKPCNTG
jgi:hypothetical protein